MNSMNWYLFRGAWAILRVTLLVGATACEASAQDGKLIDSSVVSITEDDINSLETGQPDIRDILDRVEIKSITYLSDRLKVKGYLGVPKQRGKLPCVISIAEEIANSAP